MEINLKNVLIKPYWEEFAMAAIDREKLIIVNRKNHDINGIGSKIKNASDVLIMMQCKKNVALDKFINVVNKISRHLPSTANIDCGLEVGKKNGLIVMAVQ